MKNVHNLLFLAASIRSRMNLHTTLLSLLSFILLPLFLTGCGKKETPAPLPEPPPVKKKTKKRSVTPPVFNRPEAPPPEVTTPLPSDVLARIFSVQAPGFEIKKLYDQEAVRVKRGKNVGTARAICRYNDGQLFLRIIDGCTSRGLLADAPELIGLKEQNEETAEGMKRLSTFAGYPCHESLNPQGARLQILIKDRFVLEFVGYQMSLEAVKDFAEQAFDFSNVETRLTLEVRNANEG